MKRAITSCSHERIFSFGLASSELAHRGIPNAPPLKDEYVFPAFVVEIADISPRKLFNRQGSKRLVDNLLKDLVHFAEIGWDLYSTEFWADVKEFPYVVNQMRRVIVRFYFYDIWSSQQSQFLLSDAYEVIYRDACLWYISAIEDVQTRNSRDTLVALNIVHNELKYHADSALDTLCHRLGVDRPKL